MDYLNILGLTAGALTTAAFVPQVLKTWKSKSANELSLAMLIVLLLGVALWVVYGLLARALPVIIANSLTLILVLVLLILKITLPGKDQL